ncbi:SepM family pheromone-processing serine protease [Sporosarcina highlanderae]|uniref:endopeptidase La n=1 Tax=Sporosarcina highlanderae TaxID=3035916 RepID=A0ABT8JQZ4_9BACL|nr:SepM family pheromone-processing serine protease [Sporosarcina highlanderae]MDN4607569.1 SepM family pheromone-processing serine protease [Sporosarcina highlanderae]
MNAKRIGLSAVVVLLLLFLFIYPLDAYVSKPGGAYDLEPIVEVAGGDENDVGTFSLMTISIGKATPFSYVASKFSDRMKILPIYKVRREGENDKEYNIRQKKLMSDSQFNAITVAFERVGIPVDITYDGVFVVRVLTGGAADGKLEVGDKIRKIDGVQLTEPGQLAAMISAKGLGDKVKMTVDRDSEQKDIELVLSAIPNQEGRVGLGVEFQEDRELSTNPKVNIHTAEIGGPSAGLMFTLQIMNQLMDEDITKGYNIAGTGEMLADGTVGRIGGADFKVIAADREGIEIFFAPDDYLSEEIRKANPGIMTNYEEALKMGKKIGTKMKIVPVRTVDDALTYLRELPEK